MDEDARLAALHDLALLDTVAEERFDRITRTAARLLGMPIAQINLVDRERQWAKSSVGLEQGADTDRRISFCSHVVGSGSPVLVGRTREDERFHDNPCVTGDPYLGAYFGMPVRGPSGHVLGAMCVADVEPRELTQEQLAVLTDLAGWAEAELDRTQLAELTVRERGIRERLEAITRAVGDGVVVFDADGRIETGNEAAARLLALDAAALPGMHVADLLADGGPDRRALRELLDHGVLHQPVRVEVEVQRGDGSQVPLEVTVASALEGDTYVLVGRDVSARRRAEAELHALRQRYESILDAAADAIIGLDLDGRVEYANPAAHAIFGVPEGDLLGTSIHDRFHCRHGDGSRYPWEECPSRITLVEGRAQAATNETYFRADGTPFAADYVATPLGYDGEVTGAVLMLRDVEARRAVEQLKDEFVSTVSHELRTPLTSIKGTLALVVGGITGSLPDEAHGLLTVCLENTDRLIRLVNDILDLERLGSGGFQLAYAPTTASALVRTAADAVRGAADGAGVHLNLEVEDLRLEVDADRIVQALANLLGNAVKFSPPGGVVLLTASASPEGLHLTVSDQGRGIPLEAQERIFERFGQADASDRREKGGTGLGLPIAQGLIERHGGRLAVESEPGKGATFHVLLPLHPPTAVAEGWK